jgi:hypothetical protein
MATTPYLQRLANYAPGIAAALQPSVSTVRRRAAHRGGKARPRGQPNTSNKTGSQEATEGNMWSVCFVCTHPDRVLRRFAARISRREHDHSSRGAGAPPPPARPVPRRTGRPPAGGSLNCRSVGARRYRAPALDAYCPMCRASPQPAAARQPSGRSRTSRTIGSRQCCNHVWVRPGARGESNDIPLRHSLWPGSAILRRGWRTTVSVLAELRLFHRIRPSDQLWHRGVP